MTEPTAAVLLLSGGLDSATALAIAKDEGFVPHALSFRYGQRHEHELEAAARVAEAIGVERARHRRHRPHVFGGSALTDAIDVPKDARTLTRWATGSRSPTCRRATPSSSRSRSPGPRCSRRSDIFIGVNALDYSGYPDCRPEYIEAFEQMANLATKAAVEGSSDSRSTPRSSI